MKNPSEEKLLIPKHNFRKYNAEKCLKVTFTLEGLINLNKKYARQKGIPGFIHNLFMGRDTPDRELFLKKPSLCFWACNYGYMIKPAGLDNDQNALIHDPANMKNKPGGFSLVGWIIDPRILKRYPWEVTTESFNEFLVKNYKPGFDADYLQRTPSQEGISPLEQEESPYLASILDFRPEHIDFLKEIKKATLYHIEKIYQVNPEKDKVECYFHFPYGEATTTPHLHICVNRKRHPLEMTRSIADDKLISLLENKINIADFIAGNNPYFMENTATTFNLFNQMKGVHVEVIANPLLLASPLTNSAEIFKSLDILQNSSQLIYLKTGKLIMKLKFEDLDQKIAEHTLTMRDIIEKTLAINIALKNYFPNTPDFRNPVIQGHAAWIIMYEYLSENKEKLSTEIQILTKD